MIRGIAGLEHAPELMRDVAERQLFGSYFVFTELPELPYLPVEADAFDDAARAAGAGGKAQLAAALSQAASALRESNDTWNRSVEEALYAGYDLVHPLNLVR